MHNLCSVNVNMSNLIIQQTKHLFINVSIVVVVVQLVMVVVVVVVVMVMVLIVVVVVEVVTVTSLGTYGALENESPRERFTLIFKQTSLNYCCCSEHSLLTPVTLFLYAFNGIVKKLQKGSTRWYYLIVVPHCSCKH